MNMRSRYSRSSYGGLGYDTTSLSRTGYSGMPGSNEKRGADIIAEYIVKEKVPFILGYAGHGAIGLLDGIIKQKDLRKRLKAFGSFATCWKSNSAA